MKVSDKFAANGSRLFQTTPALSAAPPIIYSAPAHIAEPDDPINPGGAIDTMEFVQQTPGALLSASGTPALESDLHAHAHGLFLFLSFACDCFLTAVTREAHKAQQEAAKAAGNITGKKRKHVRVAAGKVWEDKSLDEWPESALYCTFLLVLNVLCRRLSHFLRRFGQ